MRSLLLALGLVLSAGSGGCIFVQKAPPNPLVRESLPAPAVSGIILDSRGYQGEGLRAVWKEAGHVYLLSEQTRIGPRSGTPFGTRPDACLLTVQDVSEESYLESWHKVNNFNLWWLPNIDIGILQSDTTYATHRYYHMLLYWNESGQEWVHGGSLSQGDNSSILQDYLFRSYNQGIEFLEKFLSTNQTRPVYLIREPGCDLISIPVEQESEAQLIRELSNPRPDRRAGAALVLSSPTLVGDGSTTALDALFAALDAPEPDARTRYYLNYSISQFMGVGNLDLAIAGKIDAMAHRDVAEQLRQFIVREIPGSVLLLGSSAEPKK